MRPEAYALVPTAALFVALAWDLCGFVLLTLAVAGIFAVAALTWVLTGGRNQSLHELMAVLSDEDGAA